MLCVEMGRQGWDDTEFIAALEESAQGHEWKQSAGPVCTRCTTCVNQAGMIIFSGVLSTEGVYLNKPVRGLLY